MKAMPQLAKITIHSGRWVNFRCPYQAKVMKTLEHSSRTIGATEGGSQLTMFSGLALVLVCCRHERDPAFRRAVADGRVGGFGPDGGRSGLRRLAPADGCRPRGQAPGRPVPQRKRLEP